MKKGPTILIRCDGSSGVGFGHVVRCLVLADELRGQGCAVAFAMREGPKGIEMVQEKGYDVYSGHEVNSSVGYDDWISNICDELVPQTLILDVRDDFPRLLLRSLKEKGMVLVTLDDPTERRLDTDLAFFPPVPQIERMDWSGFTGEKNVGWEWVILRPEFSLPFRKIQRSLPAVLVTMGGSDPEGLTLKAVSALDTLEREFDVIVVLGPGFSHHDALEIFLKGAKHTFDVRCSVVDMADVFAQVDLAVAAFGVTAYELAAMGVPAVYLCLTEDHAESAKAFSDAGIGISLGVAECVEIEKIARCVDALLQGNGKAGLGNRSEKAKVFSGFQGAQNIARKILDRCCAHFEVPA